MIGQCGRRRKYRVWSSSSIFVYEKCVGGGCGEAGSTIVHKKTYMFDTLLSFSIAGYWRVPYRSYRCVAQRKIFRREVMNILIDQEHAAWVIPYCRYSLTVFKIVMHYFIIYVRNYKCASYWYHFFLSLYICIFISLFICSRMLVNFLVRYMKQKYVLKSILIEKITRSS